MNTSRWPKHMYDLRPGAGQPAPVQLESVPVWAHGVKNLTMHRMQTTDFDGTRDIPAHYRLEDCPGLRRD